MIFDSIIHPAGAWSGPVWERALRFIRELGEAAPGEYPIQERQMYAVVAEYESRARESVCYESHRRYVDLQCLLAGREAIDYAPVSILTPSMDYDGQRDVIFYEKTAVTAAELILEPGLCAIFYPNDGHMPGLMLEGRPQQVKKVVVKIACDLLEQ